MPRCGARLHSVKVAILGTGLMGSCVALAAREGFPAWGFVGFDLSSENARFALDGGIVDSLASTAEEAVLDSDLVVFATPVGAYRGLAEAIRNHLPTQAVVIDLGSVKEPAIEAIQPILGTKRYVPCHPMAGLESSGPERTAASVMKGRMCIITDLGCDVDQDALQLVERFWAGCGMKTVRMMGHPHDVAVAYISHLPHAMAYALVNTTQTVEGLTNANIFELGGGAFADMTRIAGSSPDMWADIFTTNDKAIAMALGAMRIALGEILDAVERKDRPALRAIFAEAQETYESRVRPHRTKTP